MILTGSQIKSRPYSRIISLVPSQTELLYYLGLEEQVVGITKFCVHPEIWYLHKRRVGGTKNINLEKIHQLKPDLIIANKEENVKEQIEELAKEYDVWVSDVANIEEALEMIIEVGHLTQKEKQAEKLAHSIQNGFIDLTIKTTSYRHINAAYFIWQDPYMVAANHTFINSMMAYCGLKNIFDERERYPQIELDELKDRNCEVVILSSEPYPFSEKHKTLFQQKLPGVKIILADGEMFSWYGSRLLKAVTYFEKLNMELHSQV